MHTLIAIAKQGLLLNPPTTDPATTDQPITEHLLTDPPVHRPNDEVIIFKRLENSMIFTLQNISTDGKM